MQEPAIADLARATLGHWKAVWAHHVHVLLDPSYLADPRAEARALLKAITDQVGAERRRREPKTPMLTMRPQVTSRGCQPSRILVSCQESLSA